MDDRKQVKVREARMAHWDRVTRETIASHIKRGPRVCCLDKGDVPSIFVRCPDCIKPLDSNEEIC